MSLEIILDPPGNEIWISGSGHHFVRKHCGSNNRASMKDLEKENVGQSLTPEEAARVVYILQRLVNNSRAFFCHLDYVTARAKS